jgi:hypothetical protein
MQAASAARVKVVLAGHTQCPKCRQLIAGVKDGVFPEHYVIGKIPCGWQEAQPNNACTLTGGILSPEKPLSTPKQLPRSRKLSKPTTRR